jgi:predicted metal-binding membrane protein
MIETSDNELIPQRAVSGRAAGLAFFSIPAMLFAASTIVTVIWGMSMQAMGGMPMPGGWTMSMTWMQMPGQTLADAAAAFLGMWIVMMAAMMMPSLMPMLWRYRQAIDGTAPTRAGRLTTLVGAGYFFVWTLFGIAAFPVGVALAAVEMRQPALAHAVPVITGIIVLMSGTLQFTAFKMRYLTCCRTNGSHNTITASSATAWGHGLRLGLHCSRCCFGLMVILLVVGVMDLRAMAIVMVAITAERLAPAGRRVAQVTGVVAIGAGLFMVARAAGLV